MRTVLAVWLDMHLSSETKIPPFGLLSNPLEEMVNQTSCLEDSSSSQDRNQCKGVVLSVAFNKRVSEGARNCVRLQFISAICC